MTKLHQLTLQVRRLEARFAVLEARHTPKTRPPALLRPAEGVIAGRQALWATYLALEMMHGHGRVRLTKSAFATRHGFPPSEFYRWFSSVDVRGIPTGSGPDLRFSTELAAAIAKLKNSHGTPSDSQSLRLITAV